MPFNPRKRDLGSGEEVGETGRRGAQGAHRASGATTTDIDAVASSLNRIRLNASPSSRHATPDPRQPRFVPDETPRALNTIFGEPRSQHYTVRPPQYTYRSADSRAEQSSSSEDDLDEAPRAVDCLRAEGANESGSDTDCDELQQSSDGPYEWIDSLAECSPLQEANGVKKSATSRVSGKQHSEKGKRVERFCKKLMTSLQRVYNSE